MLQGEELEGAKRRTEALKAGFGAPATKAGLKRKIGSSSGKSRKKMRSSEEEKEPEMSLSKIEPVSSTASETSADTTFTNTNDTISSVTTETNTDSSRPSENRALNSLLDGAPTTGEGAVFASPSVEEEFADLLWLDSYMKDPESAFNKTSC